MLVDFLLVMVVTQDGSPQLQLALFAGSRTWAGNEAKLHHAIMILGYTFLNYIPIRYEYSCFLHKYNYEYSLNSIPLSGTNQRPICN